MSNAILEMIYPARGGGLLNGSFENSLADGLWKKGRPDMSMHAHSAVHFDGVKSLYFGISAPGTGAIWAEYSLPNFDCYAGKRVTAMGRVVATGLGATISLQFNGREVSSPTYGGGWHDSYARISTIIDDDMTDYLKVILRYENELKPNQVNYWDCVALVLGDTYSRIEIDEPHVLPVSLPEQNMGSSGRLADGGRYGINNGVVIIKRSYRFEGISVSLYEKLRNFQRYICCNEAYEFYYTDTDGTKYKARMLSSFQDSKWAGAELRDTTMSLELVDKGIG